MSTPRNHHIVPQSYLRYFATVDGQIGVLDKIIDKHYKTSIRNAAAERDFYRDIFIDNEYIWENNFSKTVEPLIPYMFDQIIMASNIIGNAHKFLTDKMKTQLSYIIYTQINRVKKAWTTWLNCASQCDSDTMPLLQKNKIISMVEKGFDQKECIELMNKSYLLNILNDNSLCLTGMEKLLSLNWFLYKTVDTRKSFWTSDTPVAFFDTNSKTCNILEYGPIYQGCIILFPISPTLCLILCPNDLPIEYLSSFQDCILEAPETLIDSCNKAQIQQCYRQIFYYPF